MRTKQTSSFITLLIFAGAIGLYYFEVRSQPAYAGKDPSTLHPKQARLSSPQKSQEPKSSTGFEHHENCSLVSHKHNDGDSFNLQLPNGKEATFRLYYVDTPESAFKTYANGENNHQRIQHQASDLGGISTEQAVSIGKQAKEFSLTLLSKRPFTLHTQWDSPFQDHRYHAFIEVEHEEKKRWLHEILIEKGLARIITKPETLPDGTSIQAHKKYLRKLEQQAQQKKIGAWSIDPH